jgi:outer membrane PBP1 activator LpoA protein
MKNALLRVILFLSLLASLSACSVVPSTGLPSNGVDAVSASVRHANNLLRQGKKLEAADAYYKASLNQASPHKERLVLQAAEIASSAKDKSLTKHYLSKLNRGRLNDENKARHAYVRALLAVLDKHYRAALKVLPQQRGKISAALWNKIQRLRQQISKQSGYSGTSSQGNHAATLPQSTNNIAVLLPLSGRLATVGQTILKGLKAAQASQASSTKIKTYNVAGSNVITQYEKAVKDGADIIIGPLDKRKLAQLVKQKPQLARPVISLNHLSTGQSQAPAALYQFGLAPEDEAHQMANFALSRGQKRAVVLYPNSSWGKRLGQAFKRMYTSKGGQILIEKAYPNSSSSYKSTIQSALDVGIKNIDMIFLAAAPTQARLIRPMIQYLHAEKIPVYATSHIYSGQPNAGKNMDLNGIVYTEIPYILEGSQIVTVTANSGKYPRLYAMGADAFLIAKNLKRMAQNRQAISGKTGMIRLGGQRLLQRQLSLATFANGLTTPYGK